MQFTEARNYIEFSEKDRNFFHRVFFGHSIFSFLFLLLTCIPFIYFALGSIAFTKYFLGIVIFFLLAWISNSLYWSLRYIKYLNYIRFVDDRVIISHYYWNKKLEQEFNIKDLTIKKGKTGFSMSIHPTLEFHYHNKCVLIVDSYGGRFTKYWSEEDFDKLNDYFIEYQKKYLEPQDKEAKK